MKLGTYLMAPALILFLSACGGGGGGGSSSGSTSSSGSSSTTDTTATTSSTPTVSVSGAALAEYRVGAYAVIDYNKNGIRDSGEPYTTTGTTNGNFTIGGVTDGADYNLLITGGRNSANGNSISAPNYAPKGYTHVSALTTVLSRMSDDEKLPFAKQLGMIDDSADNTGLKNGIDVDYNSIDTSNFATLKNIIATKALSEVLLTSISASSTSDIQKVADAFKTSVEMVAASNSGKVDLTNTTALISNLASELSDYGSISTDLNAVKSTIESIASATTADELTQSKNTYEAVTKDNSDNPATILFAPLQETTTYLMDTDKNIVQTWASSYKPGLAVYMDTDKSIYRTGNTQNQAFENTGGSGGIIEHIDVNGTVTWSHAISTDTTLQHHDIEVMPNGHVLVIYWEKKSADEAKAAGRSTTLLDTDRGIWSDAVAEIDPSTDQIVWEWHVWDHTTSSGNENSKIDINNVGTGPEALYDWTHINSIDYNADLDQIMLSTKNMNEVWIIDHNLTATQAATDRGDLLYRFGYPSHYGSSDAQTLFNQHDAEWLDNKTVTLYNNGNSRGDRNYSSVDLYTLPDPLSIGTEPTLTWNYTADDLFSASMSGVSATGNGSYLVTEGEEGRLFIVDTQNNLSWEYDRNASIFKAEYYKAGFLDVETDTTVSASFALPDTGQTECFDANGLSIACSSVSQDGSIIKNAPSYTNNGDGTVTDNVTSLIWSQTADTNGDGNINISDKMVQSAAESYCSSLTLGGKSDWRLPSIKELYSLMNFSGRDPSGDESGAVPFIDTNTFGFGYGDESAGERMIDAQWATTSIYVSKVMNNQSAMFGLNLADGRIKGYPVDKDFYVYCVRDNTGYGNNDLTDNGDGTVSDKATQLMWQQDDSTKTYNWDDAISYCETASTGGYTDWRLPNAKELQSILDYTRSPDTTGSAAIDPLFNATGFTNEAGQKDWGFYWSSTTHIKSNGLGDAAAYVSFGRALGYMNGSWMDVHGVGAQRSDPKKYPTDTSIYTIVTDANGNQALTHGPQGDVIRVYNYARCVRDQ